jgi:hypothetical protein
MAVEGTALRKRQQIANANRMMFLWVAGVSAVVGVMVVASIFLVQKAMFNEKVLSEKSKTATTLVNNNKSVSELQNQVRVLNTNEDLKNVMVPGEVQPIQVVLDALPADANSSAFGASLQKNFLTADGIQLDSLTVNPVYGIEVQDGSGSQTVTSVAPDGTEQGNKITFSFAVRTSGSNADGLKNLLLKMERSIRPIVLTNVTVEAQVDQLVLRADGHTYYEPARSIDLKDKVIKP